MRINLWRIRPRRPRFFGWIDAVFLPVIFVWLASLLPPAFGQQAFQTSAPHAILIDAATSSVLFEKDADALVVPASTSKIMTAEIVFHELTLGHLHLDDQFVVSETAWREGGAPARGLAMYAGLNRRGRIEGLISGLVSVPRKEAAD